MLYHRACAIRNNYINNEYLNNPVAIAGIGYESGEWVVTTRVPHGVPTQTSVWVVISGAVDGTGFADRYGGSVYFNGSFEVTAVDAYKFQFTPATPDGQPVPAEGLVPAGDMWVGRFRSHLVSVRRIEREGDSTVAMLYSHGPHNVVPGQWVEIRSSAFPPPGVKERPYYGRFKVTEVLETNCLKYQMDLKPVAPGVGVPTVNPPPTDWFSDAIFLGTTAVGFSTDGGSEAVAEGNRVFHTTIGGSYHDTWSTRDQTDRNNYYSDVTGGPFQNMGGSSSPKKGLLSVVDDVATITTEYPHGLMKGEAVRIAASAAPDVPTQYYHVASAVSAPPGSPAWSSYFTFDTGGVEPPGEWFGALWQVGLAIRENNVIELGDASHFEIGSGFSVGAPFWSGPHGQQHAYLVALLRNNIVGRITGPAIETTRGFVLIDLDRAIIENNLIDSGSLHPITVDFSETLHFFQNAGPSGTPIKATLGASTAQLPESIASKIEGALLLSL